MNLLCWVSFLAMTECPFLGDEVAQMHRKMLEKKHLRFACDFKRNIQQVVNGAEDWLIDNEPDYFVYE